MARGKKKRCLQLQGVCWSWCWCWCCWSWREVSAWVSISARGASLPSPPPAPPAPAPPVTSEERDTYWLCPALCDSSRNDPLTPCSCNNKNNNNNYINKRANQTKGRINI